MSSGPLKIVVKSVEVLVMVVLEPTAMSDAVTVLIVVAPLNLLAPYPVPCDDDAEPCWNPDGVTLKGVPTLDA